MKDRLKELKKVWDQVMEDEEENENEQEQEIEPSPDAEEEKDEKEQEPSPDAEDEKEQEQEEEHSLDSLVAEDEKNHISGTCLESSTVISFSIIFFNVFGSLIGT